MNKGEQEAKEGGQFGPKNAAVNILPVCFQFFRCPFSQDNQAASGVEIVHEG